MQQVAPGGSFISRLVLGSALTGLVGTVRFRLLDNDATADDPVYGPSAADVIEDPTGSGVYVFRGTAPTIASTYSRAWDRGAGTELVFDEDLLVTSSASTGAAPSGRDLCTLADVVAYAPAYTIGDSDAIDAKLQRLITAQSELIMSEYSREIVGLDSGERAFDVDHRVARTGRLDIGDLSTLSGATVTILDSDGTESETVDNATLVPLYGPDRYATAAWEPITGLEFRTALGAPLLLCGQTVTVEGAWGFPSIPPFAREACCARTIGDYLADIADSGDEFTQKLDSIRIAGLLQDAERGLVQLRRLVAT